MYISLGLLWICLKIIRGEIFRCPIGGLTDEDLCKNLSEESFMNKYYISSFGTPIHGKNENKYDIYDIPYEDFNDEYKNSADLTVEVQKPSLYESIMSAFRQNSETKEEKKLAKNKLIYNRTFRQSIIMNKKELIVDQWNKALSIGTSTYEIKFHNKIISDLNKKKSLLILEYVVYIQSLSIEEYMVYIQSYYNAASTYYFSNNYKFASRVIKEGITFLSETITSKYKIINNDLKVWSLLFLYLQTDIENTKSNMYTSNQKKILELEKIVLNEESPSSLIVLLYRRFFIDNMVRGYMKNKHTYDLDYKKDIDKDMMITLLNKLLKTEKLNFINDTSKIYYKNIFTYNFLILAYIDIDSKNKIINLLKAIQIPVFSIEDRLLNYKANELVLKEIKLYFNDNGLVSREKFYELLEIKNDIRTDYYKDVISKLYNEYYLRQNKNLIKKLFKSLTSNETIIDQTILHVIVTSAIDIDIKSEKIETIIYAIEYLNIYVLGQNKLLDAAKNKRKTTKINKNNMKKDENYVNESLETITDLKNKCYKIYSVKYVINNKDCTFTVNINDTDIDALSNTVYSNIIHRIKNIIIAYNWLAELNGVLCTSSKNQICKPFQTALNNAIDKAQTFLNKYKSHLFLNELTHFKYLKLKRKIKIFTSIRSWELSTWPGGWNFNKSNDLLLKLLITTSSNSYRTELLMEINELITLPMCPFINMIEFNILIFRILFMENTKNFPEMYTYIKHAINEVVVTPEDRVRNLEAHELLSMLLMIHNRNAIKSGSKLEAHEIYEKFFDLPWKTEMESISKRYHV